MNYWDEPQYSKLVAEFRKVMEALDSLGVEYELKRIHEKKVPQLIIDQDYDLTITEDHGLEVYFRPTEYTSGHLTAQTAVMEILCYTCRDYMPSRTVFQND
jgi:hypothetical protein